MIWNRSAEGFAETRWTCRERTRSHFYTGTARSFVQILYRLCMNYRDCVNVHVYVFANSLLFQFLISQYLYLFRIHRYVFICHQRSSRIRVHI